MSPKILAIETTTEACSAALLHQGLIQEHYQLAPRQHTHLILPMLEALLDEATLKPRDLDAIAFCRGPGSFTGSRIGASIAQAIAFAAEIPVILVSSLQCLAQGAYRELQAERVLAAIDARMHEIYWASYQLNAEGIMSEVDAEQLSNPQQMPFTTLLNFIGVGSAWDTYHEKLALHFKKQLQQWVPQRYPRAYDVALLAAHSFQKGHFVSAAEALPVYLREKIC
ncbi:MAG: tRNA (adenosine(37)-N6)-threonylcarbamoyltransferase complex dimerization subunit type 1 TsaB [Pseudomonadota bacterium]